MPTFQRALVVEDYRLARELLTQVLERAGFEVVGVSTGAEALRRAASAVHDVILLDIVLPDMNGIEVANALRSEPATADVPIVAVTAEVAEDVRADAAKAGFDAYITKPINIRTFVSDVRQVMVRERGSD